MLEILFPANKQLFARFSGARTVPWSSGSGKVVRADYWCFLRKWDPMVLAPDPQRPPPHVGVAGMGRRCIVPALFRPEHWRCACGVAWQAGQFRLKDSVGGTPTGGNSENNNVLAR